METKITEENHQWWKPGSKDPGGKPPSVTRTAFGSRFSSLIRSAND